MLLAIPYGRKYTATATGAILKHVVCEKCSEQYSYVLERTTVGSDVSPLFLDNLGAEQRATTEAEQKLQRSLELLRFARSACMPRIDYRNIERDPTRCGGQSVVVQTRIRVATVLGCYRHGMGVEEIVQQFPVLKPADVHDALAYAYDHMDEIESDLSADDEARVNGQQRGANPAP